MANGTTIGSAYVQILPSMEGIRGRLTQAFNGEGESAGDSFGKSFSSKAGSFISGASKVMAAGITAGAGAVAALTKSAIDSYGEYEQLVGGVETLFKDSSEQVLNYANNAYKTAGLSANEYMETVTSFSASLLQSLGGNTEEAARYADMAITDMSDNANKMGSSMESIQNAYQGFAKQNYTMLDNLKLGYGGTKSEMERLVEDAEKLNSSFVAQRDEAGNLTLSYADVVDAIHIVQENMGITGTTASEASTTIQGSVGAMQAAWSNLVTGLADGNADITTLIGNLVTTIVGENGQGGVLNNIIPAVQRALDGIIQLITTAAPTFIPMAIDLIIEHVPELIEAGTEILAALVTGLVTAIPQLVAAIPDILGAIWGALKESWPEMKQAGIDLLNMLKEGFVETVSTLVTSVQTKFEEVKTAINTKIEAIKGLFNFQWSFPKLKLPHITYSLIEVPILGTIPDPRTLSVEWYKKAYNTPYMFTEPTVMGFGDGIGGEMVYGHDSLMQDIETATADGGQEAVAAALEQLTDLLEDLRRNGLVARAYLDRKEITDTVAAQMRRNQRAGGYA